MKSTTPATGSKKKAKKKAAKKPGSGQRQTPATSQAKRDAAKPKAPKPKAPTAPPAPPSMPGAGKPAAAKPKPKPAAAGERLEAIYELEILVQYERGENEKAKARAKESARRLKEAESNLEKEIHDQRVGPGPLFDINAKA